MADNTVQAAIDAGVGTSNSVQFGNVIARSTTTNSKLSISRLSDAHTGWLSYDVMGSEKWQIGCLQGGYHTFGFYNAVSAKGVMFINGANIMIGGDWNTYAAKGYAGLSSSATEHAILNNASGYNTVAIQNQDAGGFSAVRFMGDDQNEHCAIGWGNSGDTVPATKNCAYWEIFNGAGAAVRGVVNRTFNNGINTYLIFDTDGAFYIMKEAQGLGWNASTLVVDQTKVKSSITDNGFQPPTVNTTTTSAATAGAGKIVWDSGKAGFYGSNGTTWVHL